MTESLITSDKVGEIKEKKRENRNLFIFYLILIVSISSIPLAISKYYIDFYNSYAYHIFIFWLLSFLVVSYFYRKLRNKVSINLKEELLLNIKYLEKNIAEFESGSDEKRLIKAREDCNSIVERLRNFSYNKFGFDVEEKIEENINRTIICFKTLLKKLRLDLKKSESLEMRVNLSHLFKALESDNLSNWDVIIERLIEKATKKEKVKKSSHILFIILANSLIFHSSQIIVILVLSFTFSFLFSSYRHTISIPIIAVIVRALANGIREHYTKTK